MDFFISIVIFEGRFVLGGGLHIVGFKVSLTRPSLL